MINSNDQIINPNDQDNQDWIININDSGRIGAMGSALEMLRPSNAGTT